MSSSSLSRFSSRVVRSAPLSGVFAVAVGAMMALVKGAVIFLLLTEWRVGMVNTAVVDLVVTALMVSLAVYALVAFARRRRKEFIEQIQRVTALNHYVRNDLQVIVYQTALSRDSEEAIARISGAVANIDKTLRQLFPISPEAEVAQKAKEGFLKKQARREAPPSDPQQRSAG